MHVECIGALITESFEGIVPCIPSVKVLNSISGAVWINMCPIN